MEIANFSKTVACTYQSTKRINPKEHHPKDMLPHQLATQLILMGAVMSYPGKFLM
jgi:hypothetical protein